MKRSQAQARASSSKCHDKKEGRKKKAKKRADPQLATPQELGKVLAAATRPPKGGTKRSAGTTLEPADHWKEIKAILRAQPDLLATAFDCLLVHLRDKDIQVRQRSLALLDKLFQRSEQIRTLVSHNMKDLVGLVVGTPQCSLPGPKDKADALRAMGLEVIEVWHVTQGERHQELRVAYRYLKEILRLRFPDVRGRLAQEAREKEEKKRQMVRALEMRYRQERSNMVSVLEEVEGVLTQMQACYDILVPDLRKGLEALDEGPGHGRGGGDTEPPSSSSHSQPPPAGGREGSDESDIEWEEADLGTGGGGGKVSRSAHSEGNDGWASSSSSDEDYDEVSGGQHIGGVCDPNYQIEITLPPSSSESLENEDNRPLFDTLRENYGLLQGKYHPTLSQYLRLVERVQLSSPCDRDLCQDLKPRLTRVLGAVEKSMKRAEDIEVHGRKKKRPGGGGKERGGKGKLRPDLIDLQDVLRRGAEEG